MSWTVLFIIRQQREDFKRTPDEQVEVIKDIDRTGQWIFEGTNRESHQCLFDMADIIIFNLIMKKRVQY